MTAACVEAGPIIRASEQPADAKAHQVQTVALSHRHSVIEPLHVDVPE